jgi:hypothetical protein
MMNVTSFGEGIPLYRPEADFFPFSEIDAKPLHSDLRPIDVPLHPFFSIFRQILNFEGGSSSIMKLKLFIVDSLMFIYVARNDKDSKTSSPKKSIHDLWGKLFSPSTIFNVLFHISPHLSE